MQIKTNLTNTSIKTTIKTTNKMSKTSKMSKKSTKVITYDVAYIMAFQQKINRSLPVKVMKTLNMSTKIKKTMNVKALEEFTKQLDNFDEVALKKNIRILLNKLANSFSV